MDVEGNVKRPAAKESRSSGTRKERHGDAPHIGRSESWSVDVGIRPRTLLLELKSNWRCAGDDSDNSTVDTLKIFHIMEILVGRSLGPQQRTTKEGAIV